MRNAFRWTMIGALAAVLALAWWARASVTARLRNEVEHSHARQREIARLRAEHEQLVASQPTAAEMETLRADHDALAKMEKEIAATRGRLAAPPTREPDGSPAESTLPAVLFADQWTNAGAATPAATLETALWAAGGGNIDTLAGLLTLDAAAAKQAQALFSGLPAPTQAEYRSAERLIALLASKDAPTGSLQIIGQKQIARNEVAMRVRLEDVGGATRFTTLRLKQAQQEWRLVVPEKAVDRYAAMLKGTYPSQ